MKLELQGNFEDITRPLRAIAIASSDDGSRPVLSAISLTATSHGVELAATDSYRLARTTLRGTVAISLEDSDSVQVMLPAKTLIEAIKGAEKANGGKVRARSIRATLTIYNEDSPSNGHWKLDAGEHFTQSGSLVSGTYPDYNALFPKEKAITLDKVTVAWNPAFLAGIDLMRKALDGAPSVATRLVSADTSKPSWWELKVGDYENVDYLLMPVRGVA